MKIDERISNYMSLLNVEPTRVATPSATSFSERLAAANTPDDVNISSSALQRADDEARRERLDIIRRQLAEGSYNISGKDVAEKIITVLKG